MQLGAVRGDESELEEAKGQGPLRPSEQLRHGFPGDTIDFQRALEIYRVTGKPMSQLLGRTKRALPFRLLELALVPSDRAELHRRIESRFEIGRASCRERV